MTLLGTAAEATGAARLRLQTLREVILGAVDLPLTEGTRWGQHAVLPPPRCGTAVRLHWSHDAPDRIDMLVHCGTDLVARWKDYYGTQFDFAGKRALHLPVAGALNTQAVAHMAAMALTYKLAPSAA